MTQNETVTIPSGLFEFLVCAAIQHGDWTVRRGATALGIEYDEMMSLLRVDCEKRGLKMRGD